MDLVNPLITLEYYGKSFEFILLDPNFLWYTLFYSVMSYAGLITQVRIFYGFQLAAGMFVNFLLHFHDFYRRISLF